MIRTADGAASPGVLASPANFWKLLVRGEAHDTTKLALDLAERVATGDVPARVRAILMHSDLLAGPRADGRVRPIEVPSFLRKVAVGALMEVLGDEVDAVAGPAQFGCRMADGAVMAFSTIEGALDLDPSLAVASVDVSGAHANIRRDMVERICADEAPRLAQHLRLWWSEPAPKTWRGDTLQTVDSCTGFGQGFPEASPMFCGGLGRALRELGGQSPRGQGSGIPG